MSVNASDEYLLRKFASREIDPCRINFGKPEFFTPEPRPDKLSIGTLDRLPVELLHEILYMLDLKSLSDLRHVSRGGNVAVNALPLYHAIVTHVPYTLDVIRRTGLQSEYTVQRLYKILRTRDCPECGEFGGYIFLLTGERCCSACLNMNQNFWALPIDDMEQELCFPYEEMRGLTAMTAIPDKCFSPRVEPGEDLRLISLREAVNLARSNGTLLVFDMITCLGRECGHSSPLPMVQSCFCKFGPETRNDVVPEQPRYESRIPPTGYPVWLSQESNSYCNMSSIRLPYLLPDGTVDWGFYCDACMNTTTYPYLTPESEFLKHARVCEWIRDYVESNCGVPDPNIEKHDQ
ncbi:hypothetical protein H112_03310 [Trichophyton rubrum D6]|uniref:F-box domain-containing protein n=3 Tax=Trichophyton rubrum TaxID=5551 RepID=A0A178EUX9_TRIRU|nr:uncharacterized protein TERG_05915 [Trichophyton rubrum CBS 118892]EZF24066.1 hypothetical protein H100_03314 [Trichophyton rubrum MR850]EZF43199.1 hypothetical protein H102_03308 [Trichophyton rubrum CBS 100081]EZF53847.1 hypothetical protein H103_03321 [Trichophyton rubrum CBS 288.86]EZF64466.1 hypothetical protein H104_03304 [Trichophyton rubrum CBS 289.86]EZF85717.1 hypothetical protein H110_03315 [Trichophyton rubrum MR1448]EZF96525.1 hypothetical protein H113_03323 [Trichophyton rubr